LLQCTYGVAHDSHAGHLTESRPFLWMARARLALRLLLEISGGRPIGRERPIRDIDRPGLPPENGRVDRSF